MVSLYLAEVKSMNMPFNKRNFLVLLATMLLTMPIFAQDTLCIMNYNIRNARGLDNKVSYTRIANVIKGQSPHFVTVQEVDSATARSNSEYVLGKIGEHCQLMAWYAPAIPYDGGKYGIGLLMQEPALRVRSATLPGREESRVVLIAEFEGLCVASTHLSLTEADRMASIAVLDSLERLFDKPIVLCGDFNDTPNSAFIQTMYNNWVPLSHTDQPTFPANSPEVTIDFMLVNKRFQHKVKVVEAKVLHEPVASDHCPMVVRIVLK